MASGVWRKEHGEWSMASGVWRVEHGEWSIASGAWRVRVPADTSIKYDDESRSRVNKAVGPQRAQATLLGKFVLFSNSIKFH